MNFQHPEDVQQIQRTMRSFMDRHVLSQMAEFERIAASGTPTSVVEPLKALARGAGLWNPFLPGPRDGEPGTELSNMQYAPRAEIMGRVHWAS